MIRLVLLLPFATIFNVHVSAAVVNNDSADYHLRLAEKLYEQGNYQLALHHCGRSISFADATESRRSLYLSLYYMGCIAQTYSKLSDAARFYDFALTLCPSDSAEIRAKILSNMIVVLGRDNGVEQASSYYQEYERIKGINNIQEDSCRHLSNLAYLELSKANYFNALNYLNQERAYVNQLADADVIKAGMETDFAFAYLALNQNDSAIICLKRCEKILEGIHRPFLLARTYRYLSEVYEKQGNKDLSLAYLGNYQHLVDSVFNDKDYFLEINRISPIITRLNNELVKRNQQRLFLKLAIVAVLFLALLISMLLLRHHRRHQSHKITPSISPTNNYPNEKIAESIEQNSTSTEDNTQSIEPVIPSVEENSHSDVEIPQSITEISQSIEENSSSSDVISSVESIPSEESIPSVSPLFPLAADDPNGLIAQRIDAILNDTQYLCDNSFNLNTLVQLTGSNIAYVSKIINEKYNNNFRSVLNERRVKLACEKMDDVEYYGNLTISAIAEKVGYKSSNSFINAFKKVMNTTPYIYQQQAIQQHLLSSSKKKK
jgi:AraC-like DNA-binding protein/tetratricopeptide (TPR) repeat protein